MRLGQLTVIEAIAQLQAVAVVELQFGFTDPEQIAGLAALEDQAWLADVRQRVVSGRERLAEIALSNGLQPIPSATNFVTMDCGADGAFALKVMQNLLAQGVFIRKPMAPGLDRCIRISVGLDHEIDILAEELPGALAVARGN